MDNKKFCIFYTDDDKDDLDTFRDAAGEVSDALQIETQNSGDELIELLKSPASLPHLIFLDLNMPGKNGYEVLKEIREKDGIKGIPIIIFSTSNDNTNIQKSRNMGANLYMPKPWDFAELKNAIEYAISIKWETFKPSAEDYVYKSN